MSDTPKQGWMNSDTLPGCVVSFVLSVVFLLVENISAAEARGLTYLILYVSE